MYRFEETFEGRRRNTGAVQGPCFPKVITLDFEYFCHFFHAFPCLRLGRGKILSSHSYIILNCYQVVPDGFGVAYMTGYEGKGFAKGQLIVFLLKFHRPAAIHGYISQGAAECAIHPRNCQSR
jgi:hypothetical protein